jgi:hypothetical protein
VSVKVSTTTGYPFDESIRLKVEPERDVAFPLYLRIPGWCQKARITVNGTRVTATPDGKRFAKIARTWVRGDVIEVRFPMEPQVIRGYETEWPSANRDYFRFMPDSVFQPRRLPYASVLCGPLLFSLPIPDVDPNTPVNDAKWRYALDTDARRGDAGIKVERKRMPARWDWPLDAPVVLKVSARTFAWQPTDAQALPGKPVTGTTSETVRLVPYGCTKFRISMFPVTDHAWPETLESSFKTDPVQAGWKKDASPGETFAGEWVHSPSGKEHAITVQKGFWTSPSMAVKPIHYYRLTFRSKAGAAGHWAALFTDADGGFIQADVYDNLFPGDDWKQQEFYIRTHALAQRLTLRFQAEKARISIDQVSLSEATAKEAAAWVERFSRQIPAVSYVPPSARGALLPRTFDTLQKGGPLRIVLLGDSIANDTGNSLFEVRLRKLYPKAKIEVINSVRGGTGCTWYQHENRVPDYVLRFKPDLLIIAGISHGYDAEAIRSVIRQVRAKQNPEILVLRDLITPEPTMTAGFIGFTKQFPEAAGKIIAAFPENLRRMTAEEKVEYLDMRAAWNDYLKSVNQPVEWFLRDPIHANSRGKQAVGQILARYFKPKAKH